MREYRFRKKLEKWFIKEGLRDRQAESKERERLWRELLELEKKAKEEGRPWFTF